MARCPNLRAIVLAPLIVVSSASLTACTSQHEARIVSITHANVIDMTGAPPRLDQTVLIRDGRIATVAPAHDVKVPREARVIDGTGRWLIPGMWDMHVHTSRPERDIPLYLANGITAVRDMGGEAPDNPAETPGNRGESLNEPEVCLGVVMILLLTVV